jgi:hypothetical protein
MKDRFAFYEFCDKLEELYKRDSMPPFEPSLKLDGSQSTQTLFKSWKHKLLLKAKHRDLSHIPFISREFKERLQARYALGEQERAIEKSIAICLTEAEKHGVPA